MKANAPEKIQIHLIKNDYDAWSVQGYSFLADKQMGMTEYTRTDAFIEKACEWLKTNYVDFLDSSRLGINIEELVKDLKNDFKKE